MKMKTRTMFVRDLVLQAATVNVNPNDLVAWANRVADLLEEEKHIVTVITPYGQAEISSVSKYGAQFVADKAFGAAEDQGTND